MSDEALLWLSVKSTSAQPDCTILEVAAAISREDDEMAFVWQVSRPVRESFTHPDILRLKPDVTPAIDQVYERSGLWRDVESGSPLMVVEHEVMLGVSYALGELGLAPETRLVMAGTGIDRLDRSLIKTSMPTLFRRLSERSLDVTSLQHLSRRLLREDPRALHDLDGIEATRTDRALPDIYASRNILVFLIDRLRARPGQQAPAELPG